ncbi:MAG: hypothetical protein K0S61_3087 [Anaerocolumna sp.]|nr:hypothetical protein [Anaerocolumna sp.]
MRVDGHYGVNINKASEGLVEDKNIDRLDTAKKLNDSSAVKTEISDKASNPDFIDYKEELSKPKEDTKEIESHKEEDISNTSNRLTEEDYKNINDEGITLEKYNLERLDQMLTRIKSQRELKDENIISQKEKLTQKTEELRGLNNYHGADKELIKKLEKANIPVTEANVLKLSNAWEMAKEAINLSDQASAYIIKNGLRPTIENIYKAKYSATSGEKSEITDKEWINIKDQVKSVLLTAGLEDSESNLENGRWLIENQLPVNPKSLWTMADLNKMKQSVNADMVYDKGIEAIVEGYSPESASLSVINNDRVTNILTTFETVTDEVIHSVLKKGQDNPQLQINYVSLRDGQKDLKLKSSEEYLETSEELDIKTITVRRQLEEIRLKLTTEAGTKLIKNGLSIETASLTKLIDELKAVEDSYYTNLLKEGNVKASDVNTGLIKSSLLGMEELKSAPSYILGVTLSQRNINTVHDILEVGRDYKSKLAENAYETLMTAPRSDLGDSIKKAFANVDNILSDMNLDSNDANQRAVRILGYNNMNINIDSINQVKVYDAQVNHMLKNFHPAVAIEMIREGLNPLEMTVPQINEKLDTIKEELGITEEERFSKFLWKMDKNKSISETERNSFIGIYRLLNTIEKTDGAALGAVMNADQEVSMKSLLTAVQSKKNKDMDYSIDNTFGSLSQYMSKNETITSQINAAFFNNNNIESKANPENVEEKISYIKQITADLREVIEPDKLMQQGLNNLMEMPIETLYEKLGGITEDSKDTEYYQEQLENLEEIVKIKTEVMEVLKDSGLPVTVANLYAAKDYLSKEDGVFQRLNKVGKNKINQSELGGKENQAYDLEAISDTLLEGLTDKDNMVKSYEELNNNWNKSWDSFIPEAPFTLSDIRLLQGISNGMSFITQMSYKESYEIPIQVGDNLTNVNVTFLKNTGESGKVNITMESNDLGNVLAGITVKNNEANIFITSDTREGYEALLNGKENLISHLNTQELKIKQINYGMGNQIKDSSRYNSYNADKQYKGEEEKVENNTLYALAKTVLIHIKEMEISK